MCAASVRRAVVLVDGEHHPPVVRAVLEELRAEGTTTVLAVMVGGSEKVAAAGVAPDLGVPVTWPPSAERSLPGLLRESGAEVVLDLSGPPVVDEPRRRRLVAATLAEGVPYEAPGVRYDPPDLPRLATSTSVAVIATDKRSGKTALSGALVRHARQRGRHPVVVALGRGGPARPVVLTGEEPLDADRLLAVADAGGHAASDFFEDALFTGAPTVGSRRVGDGPAGVMGPSNLAAAVAAAERLRGDLTVLEGSGAAIPPCHADASLLVVPVTATRATLAAGVPLRFLLADVVVVTLVGLEAPADQLETLVAAIRELTTMSRSRPVPVVATTFVPYPMGEVAGRRVFLATTAPPQVVPALVDDLERTWQAKVVGASYRLADRGGLAADLKAAPPHDVLLTELKAAAVDVAARTARDAGVEVVFCDHRPRAVAGPPALRLQTDLADVFDLLLRSADRRHRRDRSGG